MTDKALLTAARAARETAYAPYSRFTVGAALLTAEGQVFTGCNVENAAYAPGLCAERVAIGSGVVAGARTFAAIAVVGGPEGEDCAAFCPPCGVCRQVLREFCSPEGFRIVLGRRTPNGLAVCTYSLQELLPHSFGPNHLP